MSKRTFAIIKPDAVQKGAVGFCLQMAELGGFRIRDLRFILLTEVQAEGFYIEHHGKPFFEKLVKFMTSGPCIAVALELDEGDAVTEWRSIMKKIREVEASKEHSERNAVHGSDSEEAAARELSYFFGDGMWTECWDCGAGGPHLCPNSTY